MILRSTARKGGVPEKKGGVPEKKGAIPEKKGAIPERKGGVPERKGGVPEKKGGVPEKKGGVPEKKGGVDSRGRPGSKNTRRTRSGDRDGLRGERQWKHTRGRGVGNEEKRPEGRHAQVRP